MLHFVLVYWLHLYVGCTSFLSLKGHKSSPYTPDFMVSHCYYQGWNPVAAVHSVKTQWTHNVFHIQKQVKDFSKLKQKYVCGKYCCPPDEENFVVLYRGQLNECTWNSLYTRCQKVACALEKHTKYVLLSSVVMAINMILTASVPMVTALTLNWIKSAVVSLSPTCSEGVGSVRVWVHVAFFSCRKCCWCAW